MTSAQTNFERVALTSARCDVSILVVGYNSTPYLTDCFMAIHEAVNKYSFEVLFVNNGSDNSDDLVRRKFPKIQILDSLGNIGFAAANGYLSEHAAGRWLLLLNPDTKLCPGALDVLIDVADNHPDYDVVGGVTIRENGEPHSLARLDLPSLSSLLRGFLFGSQRPEEFKPNLKISPVDALNGGFMMVRTECWTRLQGMDRDFFLYAEELDFFKRLKDIGGKAAIVADSRLYHDFGSGEIFSDQRIRFLMTGNAHYFHKHFAPPYAYACVFLLWATAMKRYLGGALLASRSDRFARMSRGFAPVARAPWKWMRGYNSTGADPRRSS